MDICVSLLFTMLGTVPPAWPFQSANGPLGGPRPASTSCLQRPDVPAEFSDSDRRGPRAQVPAPGRDKHFHFPNHFPNSLAIPNCKPAWAACHTHALPFDSDTAAHILNT